MSLGAYPVVFSTPGVKIELIQLLGTGAANPTKVHGAGVAVTWVSTGRYRLTFSESQGTYVGLVGHGFAATTPADLDGYTVVAGVYASNVVDIYVYSDTPALADLQALGYLNLLVAFKTTAVNG